MASKESQEKNKLLLKIVIHYYVGCWVNCEESDTLCEGNGIVDLISFETVPELLEVGITPLMLLRCPETLRLSL